MQKANVFEIPGLYPLGRFHEASARRAGALPLFWSGSGLEVRFTGSELHLILEADYRDMEPWISVEVNGAQLIRMPLERGETDVRVFSGMAPGSVKRVRLMNECQPMSGDPAYLVLVKELRWEGGTFLPVPAPELRLEFVGDSITSGEGAIGARQETDWVTALFSASRTWGCETARLLNADFRLISQSGWGIRSGWDNDPRHVMPDVYEQICGPACGEMNGSLGAGLENDFSAWRPDAVIVNLGSNDVSAMNQPEWRGDDGRTFRQLNTAQGLDMIEDSAAAFLRTLRKRNPSARLVWAYGMVGDQLRPQLERAVERVRRESGDGRVYYLPLPAMTVETVGAREHPGTLCHKMAAETVAKFLREIL